MAETETGDTPSSWPRNGHPALAAFRELLDESGADFVDRDGRSVPASFGDPRAEYGAMGSSAGLLDDTDRSLIGVRGEKAREFFGGLVTNHVEALPPGRGLYAFMLTSKGRPVAEMRVLALEVGGDEERLLLDLPAACHEGTVGHLKRFLPPRLARFAVVADRSRLALVGPEAGPALEGLVGSGGSRALPADPLEAVVAELAAPGGAADSGPIPVRVVRREEVEGPGFDLYLPAERLTAAWSRLAAAVEAVDGRPVGLRAREVRRVEQGVPAYGPEIHADVLPQETGQQARAVDHEKGCYTGQEVVARIHYRGHVNRHLRGLRFHLDPEELPASGDELYVGERDRGVVTTAVVSPRLGPIGLGYVRREVEPGDRMALAAGGEPVADVVELPFG